VNRQDAKSAKEDLGALGVLAVFWTMTMYPEKIATNISANMLRKIRNEVENG
jgi:hypothetical protein